MNCYRLKHLTVCKVVKHWFTSTSCNFKIHLVCYVSIIITRNTLKGLILHHNTSVGLIMYNSERRTLLGVFSYCGIVSFTI